MKTLSACLALLTLASSISLSAPAAAQAPSIPRRAAVPSSTFLNESARSDIVMRAWPNRRLLLTGSAVLVSSYGASAIVAGASQRKADSKLFLPVVGPWLDLKARDCTGETCGKDTVNKALLVGDGALQGLGALTMLLGLVVPESGEKPWYLIGNEKLSLRPQLGMAVRGLTATGKF
jgi:hypothetical protein